MPFQYIPLLDPQLRISREGDSMKAWSGLYDDIYFSSENGYAETLAVFVEPTELPERMASGKTVHTHTPPSRAPCSDASTRRAGRPSALLATPIDS